MRTFSAETINSLRQRIDAACADKESGIPGAVVVVVNRNPEEHFEYAAGRRGYGSSEPMTVDNVFWIASCTKTIVGIACMQLVEQGLLALDDSRQVETICPELKEVKVLQDDGKLVPKKRGITLRMLLSHTAGFGYSFFNEKLKDYSRPTGYDESSGNIFDISQPLVRQPGEGWEYGVGIDWAGLLVERVTNLPLKDYLHKYIFEPLNLKNISMIPTTSMKANLAYMNSRSPNGQLSSCNHVLRWPLVVTKAEDISRFNSGGGGGAGCFAKPQDFCQILAMLLNDGISSKTGKQILQKETVNEMFRNQIPEYPNFGREGLSTAKPDITNSLPDIYPSSGVQGWGLTFMITGGPTGRSSGTAFWAGLPNLWWWCDRENGVAGMVSTQVLPFADSQVLDLLADVETIVYKAVV